MADDYIRREDAIRLAEQGQVQGFPWQFQMLLRLSSADVVPVETLKAEIYKLKHQSEQGFGNHDYYVGYISALSIVEGILAVMDREE